MTENTSDLQRHIDVLEERIERMSTASLLINSSLDLDSVLQDVVDNARVLTRARYGIITTIDSNGVVEEFVTSGFTGSENDQLIAWSEGPRLFEHFRALRAPIRVADLPSYVDALGFSTELIRAKTFQGIPLYHRDVQVGNFFLAGKDGDQEFTATDEQLLRSFASQAATAIENARTHREERRVRADLDTLIDSSPVGVVVFNGRTGQLISYNGEARRIVEELGTPGREIEELLDIVTCRRADGRDVSLAESPMVRQLTNPETVHAEEITLSVPDGRNISLLCNATPIRAANGTVESLVVILQDLAPLEELTRLRAEIFSKVSDALRAPLIAIKGSSATALDASPRPDPNEMVHYFRIIDEQADRMHGLIGDLLDYGRIVTGTLDLDQVVVDVETLIEGGREILPSELTNRTVNLEINSDLPLVLVDRTRIEQVIGNLLVFTSKQSDPTFPIDISAQLEQAHVAVSLTTTNWQVSKSHLTRLFQRYSVGSNDDNSMNSPHEELDLAICRGLVEANGGRIWAETISASGGTRITFTLPLASDSLEASPTNSTIGYRPLKSKDSSSIPPILVINTNPHMQRYIQDSLATSGFSASFAEFDDQLDEKFDSFNPALVLLDLQQYGIALHDKIAHITSISDAPVIFIAPYGIDEVVIKALDAGAVDYVVTPFAAAELVARVRGALRRQMPPMPFTVGELSIDYERRKVSVGLEQIELTATEYELLRVLSVNTGRVMTYAMLLRQVWRKSDHSADDTKAVRAVVKRLRQKLSDSAENPTYICNKRGVGYFIPQANDD